ncbi:hypothetical protein ANO14919_099540 [Xylariales sp. No.14919]|nr:hypothetical protein ANO14919_099540 [Xylariales sp. No.14919]
MDLTARTSPGGAFHLPIPSWLGPYLNRQKHPMVKHTLEILNAEMKDYGQRAWSVYFAEGSVYQRVWTAETLAHREMYYAGVRGASTEYVYYQICLRLWIQRDVICYSFGIPRVPKTFPYGTPPVVGFDIDRAYAYTCMRLNVPAPREAQVGQFRTLDPEFIRGQTVAALEARLLASQRETQDVRAQLEASQREVQELEEMLEMSDIEMYDGEAEAPNNEADAPNNEADAPNGETDAPNSETDAPGSEVEATEDQGEHPEV